MGKTCKECGDTFVGRSDAKFCSDQCRSSYNNKVNGYQSSFVRKVNAILRRNRKILSELNTAEGTQVSASQLGRKGFDFAYITATFTTPKGEVFQYCYDQGFVETKPDTFTLLTMDGYD